jgi:hypothetical protein
MRKICGSLFVILATVLPVCGAAPRLVVYPEYPRAIERDSEYAVSVVQKGVKRPLVVYNHCEKSSLDGRTPWKRFEIAFDTKFDPKATGLVALFVSTLAPTDELVFRNFRLARMNPTPPPGR